jgi:hypothetical protein
MDFFQSLQTFLVWKSLCSPMFLTNNFAIDTLKIVNLRGNFPLRNVLILINKCTYVVWNM